MFWLWLLLYGLLFAVPRALAPAAAPLLTPALLAVYWAVLLRGLHTRGRLRSYGLCRSRGLTARDALLSLPVLLFAALNAAFGGARPGRPRHRRRSLRFCIWAAPLAGAFPPPRCRRCAPSARGCC